MSESTKLIGALTISRDSGNTIRITIVDRVSRVRFVELHMTPNDFATALTGLSYVEGEMTVRNLEDVGKELVIEKRQIRCPLKTYDRAVLQAWLVKNAKEEGWILDTYLGSQGSVTYDDDSTILNYSVKKYVPIAPGCGDGVG